LQILAGSVAAGGALRVISAIESCGLSVVLSFVIRDVVLWHDYDLRVGNAIDRNCAREKIMAEMATSARKNGRSRPDSEESVEISKPSPPSAEAIWAQRRHAGSYARCS
jgi:hypothetical protein